MRIIGGFQDTRLNDEDFALTPFLFSVVVNEKEHEHKIFGIGFSWGYYAIYIGIGLNIPKEIKSFRCDKFHK